MNDEFSVLSDDFRTVVDRAIEQGKVISFITYVLGDSGESKIKYILSSVLNKYQRIDLMELLYTASKELIVNSTKAAIKRIIFQEMGLDPVKMTDYDTGMGSFKENLSDKKFPYYRGKMKSNNLNVKVKFIYNPDKIVLKIINNFALLGKEEQLIREKFIKAKKYDNLFEFFMEHGDNTEGAGMGITMVEILMAQSGFDRHLFTIYSSEKLRETVAKIEIPINPDYKPKRYEFEDYVRNSSTSFEQLRTEHGWEQ